MGELAELKRTSATKPEAKSRKPKTAAAANPLSLASWVRRPPAGG